MTKILVTGVNGFVGHHVASILHEQNIEVLGVGNQPELQQDLTDLVGEYIGLDLTNPDEAANISLAGIDAIINLAGFAKVGESRGQGELYNRVNAGVHTTLYQECLNQGASPRIIAVSTGAVYDPNQPMPITEESKLIPDERTNEYVISKKLTEQAVMEFSSKGLRCIIARPFNHTGPGQLPGFLLPDLAEQLEYAQTSGQPLKVGNLDTKRDFTDVRDVARAYIALATCDAASLQDDIYNICSGKSIAGREILELLCGAYGASGIHTEIDQAKIRPNEVMDIYGSGEKLRNATGWQPSIDIATTINDFVAWRKQNS